jgi:hypothetical protein
LQSVLAETFQPLSPTAIDRIFSQCLSVHYAAKLNESTFCDWFRREQEFCQLQLTNNQSGAETTQDLSAGTVSNFVYFDASDQKMPGQLSEYLEQLRALEENIPSGTESLSKHLGDAALAWCHTICNVPIPWTGLAQSRAAHDEAAAFVAEFTARIAAAVVKNSDRADSKTLLPALACAEFATALKIARERLPSEIMPRAILLVEGVTELILLPTIARALGKSFEKQAVFLVAAGGANKLARRYQQMAQTIKLPIFSLLDADAVEQSILVKQSQRECDRLFVLEQGEIEDTLDDATFVAALNAYTQRFLASSGAIELAELRAYPRHRKVDKAKLLLRRRASMDFDKVAFAKIVTEFLHKIENIPFELRNIIDTIERSLMG